MSSGESRRGSRIGALVRACHPEPTMAVTGIGTAMAVTAGQGAVGAVAVASAILVGQLSVGWSNDYVDRERDTATGRRDKPVAVGVLHPRTVGVLALAALAVCVPLSALSGWPAASAHLLAVGLAWSYNLGVKSTVLSVVPYAMAFTLLPAFVVLGLPGHPTPPCWLLAAGALLGSGAHFANTIPDLADDARTGVRGLPHRLGERWSRLLVMGLLVAASGVLAFGPGRPGPLPVAGLVLTVVLTVAGVGSARAIGGLGVFRLMIVIVVVDLALLIAAGRSLT